MKSIWIKHLESSEDRDRFWDTVKAATPVRERLSNILNDLIKDLQVNTMDEYDSTNWSYKMADKNGQIRAYKKIIKLLKDAD